MNSKMNKAERCILKNNVIQNTPAVKFPMSHSYYILMSGNMLNTLVLRPPKPLKISGGGLRLFGYLAAVSEPNYYYKNQVCNR